MDPLETVPTSPCACRAQESPPAPITSPLRGLGLGLALRGAGEGAGREHGRGQREDEDRTLGLTHEGPPQGCHGER